MTPEDTALAELPDLPRWVEARGLLRAGRGRVIDDGDGGRLVYGEADRLVVPLDVTVPSNLEQLASRRPGTTILLQDVMLPSARWRLPDWPVAHVTLHALPPERPRAWGRPGWPTRLLARAEIEALALPAGLREELADAAGRSPVWTAVDRDRPVSFAYAAHETERWFDVSVDTLESSRGLGYGRAAATALIVDRRLKGLHAVWGVVDGNEPSRRLAARLGFAPVDELWVMTPPA